MRSDLLTQIAARLDEAAVKVTPVAQFEEELTIEEAYEAQRQLIGHRLSRGEHEIGVKMGLTSKEKMRQVGVTEMGWGRLTDAMLVDDGGSLVRDAYIHPRGEPEIAFLLGKPLWGRVSALEAHAALEGVAAAVEIIDSRFKDFKFRASDSIADNSSSAALVVGAWHPATTDFGNLGMALAIDGEIVQVGSSAAILGHPIRALIAAARLVALRGKTLEPGDIVMSGSATAAHPLQAGTHFRLLSEKLGNCEFAVR